MRLSGRKAFITGAARGIGLSVARAFAAEGAAVALADISKEESKKQSLEIKETYSVDAIGVECDVADTVSVRNAIAETSEAFDGLDTIACMAATLTERLDVVPSPCHDLALAVARLAGKPSGGVAVRAVPPSRSEPARLAALTKPLRAVVAVKAAWAAP